MGEQHDLIKDSALMGLPMDQEQTVPVGIRALMTATNQLHGGL